jgi:hypothetical protein
MIRTARPEELQLSLRENLMEWSPSDTNIDDANLTVSPALIVQQLFRNDKFLLDAINKVGDKYDKDLNQEIELREMYRLCSEATLLQCNNALSQAHEYIDHLQEQSMAKNLLLARAEQDMVNWMVAMQRDFDTLCQYLLKEGPEEGVPASPSMDWEPTSAPPRLEYTQYLEEEVQANKLHRSQYVREDSANLPATPQAPRAVKPADFFLPSVSSRAVSPAGEKRRSRKTTPPMKPSTAKLEKTVTEKLNRQMAVNFEQLKAELVATLSSQLAEALAVFTTPLPAGGASPTLPPGQEEQPEDDQGEALCKGPTKFLSLTAKGKRDNRCMKSTQGRTSQEGSER